MGIASFHHATITLLSQISTPAAMMGAGTGAVIGAIGGGAAAAGPSSNPSSTGRILAGMLTGATIGSLIGGLAVAYTPATIGNSVAVGGGALGALAGTFTGGRTGGARGALFGAARGVAAGAAAGGAIWLLGGLCSAVVTAGTATTGSSVSMNYGEIAAGTAVASYLAAGPGRVNHAFVDTVTTVLPSRNSSNTTAHQTGSALHNPLEGAEKSVL